VDVAKRFYQMYVVQLSEPTMKRILHPSFFGQLEPLVRQPIKHKTCQLLRTKLRQFFSVQNPMKPKYVNDEKLLQPTNANRNKPENALLKTF